MPHSVRRGEPCIAGLSLGQPQSRCCHSCGCSWSQSGGMRCHPVAATEQFFEGSVPEPCGGNCGGVYFLNGPLNPKPCTFSAPALPQSLHLRHPCVSPALPLQRPIPFLCTTPASALRLSLHLPCRNLQATPPHSCIPACTTPAPPFPHSLHYPCLCPRSFPYTTPAPPLPHSLHRPCLSLGPLSAQPLRLPPMQATPRHP